MKAINFNHKLRREQIDRLLSNLLDLKRLRMPKRGWIYEIRNALSMTQSDLAKRMSTIKQRVHRIEQDEIDGRITISYMKKAAEALGCEFVYALVPKEGLQKSFEKQAYKAAEKIVRSVSHSMKLEKQAVSIKKQKAQIEKLARELIESEEKSIWKKK